MPIDAAIPLGVQPVKIEPALNRLAGVGEAMKIGEMQRGIETQNQLRNIYSQGVDLLTPEGFQKIAAIDPATAIKLRADALQGRKLEGDISKNAIEIDQKKYDLVKQRMSDLSFNPSDSNIKAHLEDGILRKEVTPQQAQQTWQAVAKLDPTQRKNYFTELGVKAEERYKMAETQRHNKATESISALAYDPTRQGQVAEAKKIGEARAEGVIAPIKDARANLKALKTAGYDPINGTDKVTDLIKASTSGALQTGAAGTLGALNYTTSGQEAIGKLASISKTLTLDLLDGKLGAGISNDDRVALEQRFGDMANSLVPSDKRLAAWNEAKEIMRNAAMLPEPGAAPAAAPSGGKGGKPSLNDIFNPKK